MDKSNKNNIHKTIRRFMWQREEDMIVIYYHHEGDRDIRTNKTLNLVHAALKTPVMCFYSIHNDIIKREKVN